MTEQYFKDEYIYDGAGFPVTLLKFPFRKIREREVLDVDTEKLDVAIAQAVLCKPAFLSGTEIHFLRNLLGQSLREFAANMGSSAPTIKKWEDLEEDLLSSPTTDFAIRNFVAGELHQRLKINMEFACHREAIQASQFWEPQALQIPFEAVLQSLKSPRIPNLVHSDS